MAQAVTASPPKHVLCVQGHLCPPHLLCKLADTVEGPYLHKIKLLQELDIKIKTSPTFPVILLPLNQIFTC